MVGRPPTGSIYDRYLDGATRVVYAKPLYSRGVRALRESLRQRGKQVGKEVKTSVLRGRVVVEAWVREE